MPLTGTPLLSNHTLAPALNLESMPVEPLLTAGKLAASMLADGGMLTLFCRCDVLLGAPMSPEQKHRLVNQLLRHKTQKLL